MLIHLVKFYCSHEVKSFISSVSWPSNWHEFQKGDINCKTCWFQTLIWKGKNNEVEQVVIPGYFENGKVTVSLLVGPLVTLEHDWSQPISGATRPKQHKDKSRNKEFKEKSQRQTHPIKDLVTLEVTDRRTNSSTMQRLTTWVDWKGGGLQSFRILRALHFAWCSSFLRGDLLRSVRFIRVWHFKFDFLQAWLPSTFD